MPVKGLQLLRFVAFAAFSTAAFAEEQPRSMLGDFDLRSIILSPTPLGPPSRFEPPPTRLAPPPTAEKRPGKKPVAEKPAAPNVAAPKPAASQRQATSKRPRQRPAAAARTPRRNPSESYARDPRRQTWPCAGDGICAWKSR
jgi:hypothetical protein